MSHDVKSLYQELMRLNKLSISLLDTLHATITWIMEYSRNTGTSIPNMGPLTYLMKEVVKIMSEMTLSDDSYRRRRSDDNLTEPRIIMLKSPQIVAHKFDFTKWESRIDD
jgi:hypothetical protein